MDWYNSVLFNLMISTLSVSLVALRNATVHQPEWGLLSAYVSVLRLSDMAPESWDAAAPT